PNPLVDHFRVSFTLPDAAPARLEVVDVGGRRVSAQDVGALGPGPHALDLGAARALAPGLYFVRLTHGGRTLTTRAVVVGR
ncbi:MAG TPA: T9SS type A sorting domain-containing protein, partial [Candidatus Eisenbacteria bacterium]|nr:T9SS type A sorting domain-containing protein [Candidatus Eisenbacteria bacterium]